MVPQGENAFDGTKEKNIQKKNVIGETAVFINSGQRGAVEGGPCPGEAGSDSSCPGSQRACRVTARPRAQLLEHPSHTEMERAARGDVGGPWRDGK